MKNEKQIKTVKHGMQTLPLSSHILPDNDFKPVENCLLCDAITEADSLTPTPHKKACGWVWVSSRGRFLCPSCFARYDVTIKAYEKQQQKDFNAMVLKWSKGIKI